MIYGHQNIKNSQYIERKISFLKRSKFLKTGANIWVKTVEFLPDWKLNMLSDTGFYSDK